MFSQENTSYVEGVFNVFVLIPLIYLEHHVNVEPLGGDLPSPGGKNPGQSDIH